MVRLWQTILVIGLVPALAACISSSPPPGAVTRPAARPPVAGPPPRVNPTDPAPPKPGFIAPQIMRGPGLEGVIGQSAAQLQRQFGQPRLDIPEGDARKLQFSGEACVLDIFLYPLQQGAQPVATHVEARRASDGRAVDRGACVAALGR